MFSRAGHRRPASAAPEGRDGAPTATAPARPRGGGPWLTTMTRTENVGTSPCTVAVIDDDHGVRAALCNLLNSAGYRSCAFAAGEEFLAGACLQETACAIVDLGLSRMSGLELAERLARLRPGLPVILMSARNDAAQRQRADALGAAPPLLKPVDAETLLARLRAVLSVPGSGTMRT